MSVNSDTSLLRSINTNKM